MAWMADLLEEILDFSQVLNASISASWLICMVILLRLFLKKAPKWIFVTLWGIVALRLLLPFSIESVFSLMPSAETVPMEMLRYEGAQLQETAQLNIITNPIYRDGITVPIGQTVDRMQIHLIYATLFWLAGMAVLCLYAAISYWRLKQKLSTAVLYRDNIFQSERISTPFVLGIIKPKIYLPFRLNEQVLAHVIAHEQAHISRKDHWWKPLGFLLLTIHWFNPLIWVAYLLLCRDMELACDEKAVQGLNLQQRADYSEALLTCSTNHRKLVPCPLAFGEVGVKKRVKAVLHYRKPAFWMTVLAIIACLVVAICFLTNPVSTVKNPWVQEYLPGTGNIQGNVDKEHFESISEDFAIGADRNGMAVFKNPKQAFTTFTKLYAEGIALIQEENRLSPLSQKNYDLYKTFGWQVTTGTPAAQEQAHFVTLFLDIYENSFSKSNPSAENTQKTVTSLSADSSKMIPTIAKIEGAFDAYLYVPLDGEIYRYERTDGDMATVTKTTLLDQFTEEVEPTPVQWTIYALQEYPDYTVVLAETDAGTKDLYQYSPPKRVAPKALAEAEAAGCVILSDGDVTAGEQTWLDFVQTAEQKEACTVQVAHYYTLNPETCNAQYYEAYQEDYPALYVFTLTFTGSEYILRWEEGTQRLERTYSYLLYYPDVPIKVDHTSALCYVLTNDATASWQNLMMGAASSQEGEYIDFFPIYRDTQS